MSALPSVGQTVQLKHKPKKIVAATVTNVTAKGRGHTVHYTVGNDRHRLSAGQFAERQVQ